MLKRFANSVTGRIIISGFLILVLMIPVLMVQSLVSEREYRHRDVQREIASKWGNEQTLSGPFVLIPVKRQSGTDDKGRAVYVHEKVMVMPEELNIKADINTFKKKRGIYEAVLYNATLTLEGWFSRDRLKTAYEGGLIPVNAPGRLALSISDTRGFDPDDKSYFNGKPLAFTPGTDDTAELGSGVSARIDTRSATNKISFKIVTRTTGSARLFFSPTARRTSIQLKSNWPSPKFNGAYLPRNHKITSEGFEADYQVSWFGRSYDQVIHAAKGKRVNVYDSSFGVEMITVADHYQKTDRSVKYGFLFLVLTFGAFFISEILFKLRLHPVQYLMIGSIMILFYLLLLSLSEHISFEVSYFAATLAVSAVIGSYSFSVLKKGIRSLIPAGVLTGLYGFLYILLQSEDHALLAGSLLLFVLLALSMYLTRKIDWYEVDFGNQSKD